MPAYRAAAAAAVGSSAASAWRAARRPGRVRPPRGPRGASGAPALSGGPGADAHRSASSAGASSPSPSRSARAKARAKKAAAAGVRHVAWSGAPPVGHPANAAPESAKSSPYPYVRSTAHVVSRRPRSMKRACRKRKPGSARPAGVTPAGTRSATTCLTPANSSADSGAAKQRTWNALSSASDRAPSPSASHAANTRRSARTAAGRSAPAPPLAPGSNRGAVGCTTDLRA